MSYTLRNVLQSVKPYTVIEISGLKFFPTVVQNVVFEEKPFLMFYLFQSLFLILMTSVITEHLKFLPGKRVVQYILNGKGYKLY